MVPKSNIPRNHYRRHFLKKGKEIYSKSVQICFLGGAVDSTLLQLISTNTPQSANRTKETMKKTQQLLYYIAKQEESIIK